ncbi:MAG: helix-hairpin-helix domain-containing protein [Chlorobium sp.]|uniref:helix-hairpin-helix domain-containing protein n=1 Tax=Chlorobium sp. TaxID=1095 RepID=UPI0025BBEDC3|nr:helix-hairpin-helix domain-containing protein [Chlorobium sp.]MCF8382366.1 helix-hairpin-helix domain-containing protein [Chlorobium sp.]
MNPSKVVRDRLGKLTDLPNIGKAVAKDLNLIGVFEPGQLQGRCPLEMYRDLCEATDTLQDPCVIDVFMSVTSFMSGNDALPWWSFTAERKRLLAGTPGHQGARKAGS